MLRRLQAAFLVFSIGEWATWLAIVVYAYNRGGATEAAVVAFIQLVPSVVLAPAISLVGDRFSRARFLVATYLFQGLGMALAAAALLLDAPAPIVYVAATFTATSVTLTRPAHASLLPAVVARPEELTAANVASGSAEGLGALIGPALAGVLVALGGPGAVFVTLAVSLLAAAAVVAPVAGIQAREAGSAVGDVDAVDDADGIGLGTIRGELLGGVAAISRDPQLRATIAIVASGMFLLGSMDILYAVLAFDLLGIGESGVGFLGAATGVGALIGSFAAVGLVGRERLGVPFVGAGVLFGLALAGIGLAPNPVVAPLLLALAGVGSALVYVAGQTLIQRLASDDVLSRVFGVLEGLMMAATALGAISVPLIVALVGPAGAFVVAGLSLPIIAVLLGRSISAGDRATLRTATELALLRAVPMLAPLPAATLERLARGLERIEFPAGAPIVRQGERGDRYYVIAEGTVTINIDGRAVREQGPGEGFGEIALMRDVPRTASVSAIGPVVAYALGRDAFIEAVTRHPASRHAADSLVRERLETA